MKLPSKQLSAIAMLLLAGALLLAREAAAQPNDGDTCPAALQKLTQAERKTKRPEGSTMPTLNLDQIDSGLKEMEECRWEHSGVEDSTTPPYEKMLIDLKHELSIRYENFLAAHKLLEQFKREDGQGTENDISDRYRTFLERHNLVEQMKREDTSSSRFAP